MRQHYLVVALASLGLGQLGVVCPARVAAQEIAHLAAGVGSTRYEATAPAATQAGISQLVAQPGEFDTGARQRGSSIVRGGLIGALVGGVGGYLVARAMCENCDEPAPVITMTALSTATGAVIGAIVAARR